MLIFPGQHLAPTSQEDFARRFGDIEILVEGKRSIAISNRGEHGQPIKEDSVFMQLLRGNEGWHTDSSYMRVAAKASVLSARTIAPAGGETEWADMRAAYQALDPGLRERISTLAAHHSIAYSQARAGHALPSKTGEYVGGYGFEGGPPPLRPLVKVHPETGRPSLLIGRHAHAIPGLDPAESERLLDELVDFACQPPRVYRHAWTPGDAVVWDNRCLLHRGMPWDMREARVMYHARVKGDAASEGALGVDLERKPGDSFVRA